MVAHYQQFDLDLSVEEDLWATQKHNEGILDQAYRTSTDVYLIFGVNKSGEFYGYARYDLPRQSYRCNQVYYFQQDGRASSTGRTPSIMGHENGGLFSFISFIAIAHYRTGTSAS